MSLVLPIFDYSPQDDRVRLFRRAVTFGLAALLIFFLSVYAPSPRPKLTVIVAIVALAFNGRRSLTPVYAPLLAIIFYDLFITHFFPAPKPDLWTVLQRPMFMVCCMTLASLCLTGSSLRTQYFVLGGMLLFSLGGVVGEMLGHDMTALLPFEMPNDVFFDNITMDSSGASRIRGFFPESGVLGAACMSAATITGLSALILLFARAHIRLALFALASAVTIGGAILVLTITKSGAFLMMFGLAGFGLRVILSRDRLIRTLAVGGVAVSAAAAVAFLLFAPPTITGYFKGEILTFLTFRDVNSAVVRGHMGMFTRIECWKAAFYAVYYYPMGVGPWGLGRVLEHSIAVTPTTELRMFFDMDIFGLKCMLANIMAETGLIGLGLLGFWLWVNFALPARTYYRLGTRLGLLISGLYWASAFIAVGLLFSCELYPHFAFMILLKFHADTVAKACCGGGCAVAGVLPAVSGSGTDGGDPIIDVGSSPLPN